MMAALRFVGNAWCNTNHCGILLMCKVHGEMGPRYCYMQADLQAVPIMMRTTVPFSHLQPALDQKHRVGDECGSQLRHRRQQEGISGLERDRPGAGK